MYKEIESIIFLNNLSKSDLAKELGMSYNTFCLKLRGRYSFSLDEAVKLKEILPTKLAVEDLFEFTN